MIAALGERDQLLDLGLDGLRLRLAGLDPLVDDQLLGEVREQRLAVRGVAAQQSLLAAVAHGRESSRAAAPGPANSGSRSLPRSTSGRSSESRSAPTPTCGPDRRRSGRRRA